VITSRGGIEIEIMLDDSNSYHRSWPSPASFEWQGDTLVLIAPDDSDPPRLCVQRVYSIHRDRVGKIFLLDFTHPEGK
jgi:hypothetical protein